MGDEQCFQTTAPEAWFGWALASAGVAMMAGLVAIMLWLPRASDPFPHPRTWKQRVAPGVLSSALLAVAALNLSTMSRDEVGGTLTAALVLAPFVAIGVWRAWIVRAGQSLSHRQQVVLTGARVVTIVTVTGAGIAAIGILAAYMASSVRIDCSTIPG
jgi:hypothetical protein